MATDRRRTNIGYLIAIHYGEFPIYDVKARIVDLELFDKNKGKRTIQNLYSDDIIVDIGSMPVQTASRLSEFNLGEGDKRDFNIFFSARNGLCTQLLRLRKLNGKWFQATRVKIREGNTEKKVFEQIDPGSRCGT